jgi:tetratricopeptide (TPR) repeat protein
MPALPIELIERIEREKCVLFVGPEASLPAAGLLGPPGPATLAAEIVERLGYVPHDVTLPSVAQHYEIQTSRHELQDFVTRRMADVRYQPTLTHHWIAALPFAVIVSTAYDMLLERTLRERRNGRDFQFVHDEADLQAASKPYLMKLYGTAEKAQSLILTEDQCNNLFEQGTALMAELQRLSGSNSLLFVGYRLEDTAFRRLFWKLRSGKRHEAPAAFFVQQRPPATEVSFWRQRGLVTLATTAARFCAELADDLSRRQGLETPPAPEATPPPPMDEDQRRRLDQVVITLLRQLGIGGTFESRQQLRAAAPSLDYVSQLVAEYEQVSRLDAGDDGGAGELSLAEARNQAQIHLHLGHAAWTRRNYDQAREQFEAAIRTAPDSLDAYLALHSLLAETGDKEAALAYYHDAISRAPDRAWLPRRYTIQEVLGARPLGITYRARDVREERDLAVTVLWESFVRDREALDQFAETMARLQHPRIPSFVGPGWHGGHHFLAWSYITGTVLADALQERELPVAEALTVLEQVAEALEYAHEQGVVHRGLNPALVILTPDRGASVVQFAEATLLVESGARLSRQNDESDYLAPEQRAGDPPSPANDIYSLGTLAYRLFTGRLPGSGTYVQPSVANPEADEALDVFVDTARAVDPAHRYSSMASLRHELQRLGHIHRAGRDVALIQATHNLLRRVTRWMEQISGQRALTATLLLLLALILVEFLTDSTTLQFIARVFVLLGVNVYPASLLANLRVREMARETGFGSLMHSGRGLGAIFAILLTAWELWNTQWTSASTQNWQNPAGLGGLPFLAPGGSFVPFVLTAAILSFALTFVMLLTVREAGKVTKRYWRTFSAGFYLMFLLWCLLLLVLTVVPVSYGIISVRVP